MYFYMMWSYQSLLIYNSPQGWVLKVSPPVDLLLWQYLIHQKGNWQNAPLCSPRFWMLCSNCIASKTWKTTNAECRSNCVCNTNVLAKNAEKKAIPNHLILICSAIQEVPTFRDFWFQRLIMKCGDHEFCELLKKRSKADWRAVDSSKKQMEEFVLFAYLLFTAKKNKSSIRFLGESDWCNLLFGFIWPLAFCYMLIEFFITNCDFQQGNFYIHQTKSDGNTKQQL